MIKNDKYNNYGEMIAYEKGYIDGYKAGYSEALEYLQKELGLAKAMRPVQYLVDKDGIHLIEEIQKEG